MKRVGLGEQKITFEQKKKENRKEPIRAFQKLFLFYLFSAFILFYGN